MHNQDAVKAGYDRYGPKPIVLENVTASCKWCYCTKDMHIGGNGKCKFCDQCQGFDPGGVSDSKVDQMNTQIPSQKGGY
jgi:hypothetical protein